MVVRRGYWSAPAPTRMEHAMFTPLRQIIRQLFPGTAAVLLAACAYTGDTQAPQPEANFQRGPEVRRICAVRSISGFQRISNQSLLVTASPKRRYLVETTGFCPELDFAFTIGLETFSGCLTWGDRIVVPPLFDPHRRRHQPLPSCRVHRIYEWVPKPTPEPSPTVEITK